MPVTSGSVCGTEEALGAGVVVGGERARLLCRKRRGERRGEQEQGDPVNSHGALGRG